MLSWFPFCSNDERFLSEWADAPISFDPQQPIDAHWHVDAYEQVLGIDSENGLFDRAAALLMRYEFYPPEVLRHVSTFTPEGREARPGDRIVQRIRVIPHVLDVVTMNVVSGLIVEPNRRGITYTTTERHLEIGEWTCVVSRRPSGEVVLLVHAVSKVGPRMPFWARPFARYFQLRGHRLGTAHFKKLLGTKG